MTISTLITARDNFEIIRDEIAAILATETASQQAIATGDSVDPTPWKFRVFSERSNAWEFWLNPDPDQADQIDKTPVVHVAYDNSTFSAGASNTVERQKATGTFYVDCYGCGISKDLFSGGHQAGDKKASLEAQRTVRLVRKILMAGEYTYLGLRKNAWRRWTESVQMFQPQVDNQPIQHVRAARLTLTVDFSEFSPQVQGEPLELVATSVLRTETGQVVLKANYDLAE